MAFHFAKMTTKNITFPWAWLDGQPPKSAVTSNGFHPFDVFFFNIVLEIKHICSGRDLQQVRPFFKESPKFFQLYSWNGEWSNPSLFFQPSQSPIPPLLKHQPAARFIDFGSQSHRQEVPLQMLEVVCFRFIRFHRFDGRHQSSGHISGQSCVVGFWIWQVLVIGPFRQTSHYMKRRWVGNVIYMQYFPTYSSRGRVLTFFREYMIYDIFLYTHHIYIYIYAHVYIYIYVYVL